MFAFWYPEHFNELKKVFQEHISKQKLQAYETNDVSLEVSSEIAENFLHSIDTLMNLNYWTAHADDVLYLLKKAKACYVDHDYTEIGEMQKVINHLFTHLHAEEQLNLHLMQYTTCTLLGLSIFYTPTTRPILHLYALYRGLSGLACNYFSRIGATRENIELFVKTVDDAQKEHEYHRSFTHF